MHEAQAPYKLALNRNDLWEVRWSEHNGKRWVVRTWSTGAAERASADAAAEQFWSARHLVAAHTGATRIGELPRRLSALEAQPALAAQAGEGFLRAQGRHRLNADKNRDDIADYREMRERRGIKPGTIRRELARWSRR